MRGQFFASTILILCWLVSTTVVAQSTSGSNTQSKTPSKTPDTTQNGVNDSTVQFLPGLASGSRIGGSRIQPSIPPAMPVQRNQLGQVQPNQLTQPIDPRVAPGYTARQPERAAPIPGAQPISRANEFGQSVLTDLQSLNRSPASKLVNNASPLAPDIPAALIRDEGNVRPAAFFEAEPPGEAPNRQQDSNPTTGLSSNVVDARITTVTRGMEQLPNQAGQVWRSYDITPYTYSVKTQTRAEQAVIDWVLKETGTEMWFRQPMGILNASRDKLYVYHTPAVQERIKPIVDRFVQSRGRQLVMGMKLLTIASPNWRSSAFSMMRPIEVNSPGVEAWLMSKENAAILSGMLRKRSDYQEHSNNDLIVADGQQYNMSNARPIDLTRSIGLSQDGTRYEAMNDRIDEGYKIDFSALSSLDGRSIEAIVGCDINQIEKIQKVKIDLPTATGQPQPYELQIPQMVRWNVRERFRWPSDMVLVLSCGVVATPGPQRQALLGLPSLFNGNRRRADALMFIEYKGLAGTLPTQANNTNNPYGGSTNGVQGAMIPVTPRR